MRRLAAHAAAGLAITLALVGTALRPAPTWGARDTVTIGFNGDASFINPVIASDGISYQVEWSVFDCLVERAFLVERVIGGA